MAVVSKDSLPPFGHALAGSAGAMFALALVYPLDIIKTRIQVQAKHENIDEKDQENYKSAMDGILQILNKEGISGLYAGLGSSLFGTAFTNFTYFYCYSLIRASYNRRYNRTGGTLSTALELALGAAAGALTTLVTTPVSVVTTRQQTLPISERQNLVRTCKSIIKEEGVEGLWHGIKPSLILCVNPAITYASFEKIKQFVLKSLSVTSLSPGLSFLVGALSKTLATVITYPYIMAKVRLQWKPSKDMKDRVVAYKGALDVLSRVLKTDGFFGWYKGMSTQITKAVLSQALLFMMKDIFTNYTVLLFALVRATRQKVVQ
ncbi:mitochondrial carrier domain-containing protein [Radiomyces spectabilis]|uniref:mitochondrial carrier domain-containing protein n=1 Tax=Radiomyces spectabilis TaxID=64574 RepID=UPI00222116FF|nr:mitochondrial carrier domain-containing protein [Radiomyces spectabilis]KAI8370558.1 mitochondrial carrier domain-containing protein [Radiomyces spectabilis]